MSPPKKYDMSIYSCPAALLWTEKEKSDPEKRRCHACQKVCDVVVHRYFTTKGVNNYCSVECFEND